ncbi:MAG: ABC transporter substrate-binding protein [Nocardioidaceae bacterium]
MTLGLEVPLSPPGDVESGQLIKRGAKLAVQYVNGPMGGVLGGRKIRIAVQDTKGQPQAGSSGYRTLVQKQHAVAVTGFFHSSVNLAVNEVAKSIGTPTLGTQSSAADITAKHYDIAFRTHVIDPVRVAAWLKFIKNKGYHRVSMIAEDTDYGIGLSEETKKQVKDKGMDVKLQSITFDHTATDLTAQMLKIKAWHPDLVINIGVGHPADLILDQASTVGLLPQTPMLISYDAPVRPDFWKLHPKDGAGVYFIAYYSPKEPLSKAGKWFAKKYQGKYGESPVYSSLNGFGDVLLLAEAVDKAGATDSKKLIQSLQSNKFGFWTKSQVTLPKADGVYWHNWSPPVLILHYTKAKQDWKKAPLVLKYSGSE